MRHLKVRNHERFQHYRDRCPPWVKWHRSCLDSYRFTGLPDAAKWHAVGLALLATADGNHLPADPSWLATRIAAREPLDIAALVASGFLVWCDCAECSLQPVEQDASAMLSPRYQNAPEHAREKETETERERDIGSATHSLTRPNGREGAETVEGVNGSAKRSEIATQVETVWQSYCWALEIYRRDTGGRYVRPALTERRRKLIRDAIKQHGPDAAERAGRGIFLDPFHSGQNDDKREYLQPEYAWRINAKVDNIERFAALVDGEE